jgi:hypothetical protein
MAEFDIRTRGGHIYYHGFNFNGDQVISREPKYVPQSMAQLRRTFSALSIQEISGAIMLKDNALADKSVRRLLKEVIKRERDVLEEILKRKAKRLAPSARL